MLLILILPVRGPIQQGLGGASARCCISAHGCADTEAVSASSKKDHKDNLAHLCGLAARDNSNIDFIHVPPEKTLAVRDAISYIPTH